MAILARSRSFGSKPDPDMICGRLSCRLLEGRERDKEWKDMRERDMSGQRDDAMVCFCVYLAWCCNYRDEGKYVVSKTGHSTHPHTGQRQRPANHYSSCPSLSTVFISFPACSTVFVAGMLASMACQFAKELFLSGTNARLACHAMHTLTHIHTYMNCHSVGCRIGAHIHLQVCCRQSKHTGGIDMTASRGAVWLCHVCSCSCANR